MIEETLLDYLGKSLTVPVVMERQPGLPSSFVLIERTGSAENDYIQTASFTIQSYGQSLYQAAVLNEKVKDVMRKMVLLPSISSADLETDYEWTDPQTKEYRYQALYTLTMLNQ